MSISQVRRVQPASKPTKCGASRMSGCPLSATTRSSPTIFTSRITRSRDPHHRIERSRTLRPKARKIGKTDLAPLAPEDIQQRTESGADRSEQAERQEAQYPDDGDDNSGQQD